MARHFGTDHHHEMAAREVKVTLSGEGSFQRRSSAEVERYAAYVRPFTTRQKRELLGPELAD